MATISDDLLPEILSRLPIKPLFQFKCVSKRFYQIITSILSDPKLLALKSVYGFFHFSYLSPQNERYLSLHPKHHPVENSTQPKMKKKEKEKRKKRYSAPKKIILHYLETKRNK